MLVAQQLAIETFFGFPSTSRHHVYVSRHEDMSFLAVESWGLIVVNVETLRRAPNVAGTSHYVTR